MSILSSKSRNRLKSTSFALPGKTGKAKGSYPIMDRAHAANALSRVSEYGSPAEMAKVRAAVHKKFPSIGKKSR